MNKDLKHPQFLYSVAKSGLRIRNSPDLKSESIALIPFGEKVEIIDAKEKKTKINNLSGNWMQVEFQHHRGWTFSGYLSANKPVDIQLLKNNGNFKLFISSDRKTCRTQLQAIGNNGVSSVLFNHSFGDPSEYCYWASHLIGVTDLNNDGASDFLIQDDDDVAYSFYSYVSSPTGFEKLDLLDILKKSVGKKIDVHDLEVANYETPEFNKTDQTITFHVTENHMTDNPVHKQFILKYNIDNSKWVVNRK